MWAISRLPSFFHPSLVSRFTFWKTETIHILQLISFGDLAAIKWIFSVWWKCFGRNVRIIHRFRHPFRGASIWFQFERNRHFPGNGWRQQDSILSRSSPLRRSRTSTTMDWWGCYDTCIGDVPYGCHGAYCSPYHDFSGCSVLERNILLYK